MAAKKASTRNSERRSGKAWGKNHNAPVKVSSQATRERRALRTIERAKKAPQSPPGSNYTMPDFDWGWATEHMQGRHIGTHRERVVKICVAEKLGKPLPETPGLIEQARTPRPRKSDSKAGAKR